MPAGRPTTFTPALGESICKGIASGKSLRELCEQDGMPNRDTVMAWFWDGRHIEFSGQYARALNVRASKYAEEIVDISDNEAGDSMRDRLRVDARKWVVSKLLPRAYGDKVEVEHSGEIKTQDKPAGVPEALEILRAAGLDV